jgi:hypothetical protein
VVLWEQLGCVNVKHVAGTLGAGFGRSYTPKSRRALTIVVLWEQVLAGVERSWLGAGAVPVRVAVDASRQLGCVVLREPWRVALFDMAEGEEQEQGDDDAPEEQEQGDGDGDASRTVVDGDACVQAEDQGVLRGVLHIIR